MHRLSRAPVQWPSVFHQSVPDVGNVGRSLSGRVSPTRVAYAPQLAMKDVAPLRDRSSLRATVSAPLPMRAEEIDGPSTSSPADGRPSWPSMRGSAAVACAEMHASARCRFKPASAEPIDER